MDIQKISEALVEARKDYEAGDERRAMEGIIESGHVGDVFSLAGVMVQMIQAGVVQVDQRNENEEEN